MMNTLPLLRSQLRMMVRGFGFLAPKHASGLSFSKVHALIEIEKAHLNAKTLAQCLQLDKSTVSRILLSLVKDGLVLEKVNTKDGRSKVLTLTALGREKLKIINDQADEYLLGLLDFLSPEITQQFSQNLKAFTRAHHYSKLNEGIKLCLIQSSDNRAFEQLARSVLAEFGANREGFAYTDAELKDMAKVYSQQGWLYYVAKENGKIIGGAGIGPLKGGKATICELKKMYLSLDARGKGLGKRLLKQLISQASHMGYKQCYLETLASMKSANTLYRMFNFSPLSKPLGDTGHSGCDSWYLLDL